MNQLLYIDTNIYLRFYDSNQAEYKKLLETLGSLSNKIFITKQIQYEIDRNKVDVFRNSFETYLKQARSQSNITLPEHLDNIHNDEISLWNKERGALMKSIERSNRNLQQIYQNKINTISKSEDEVSKTMKTLFKKAIDYSTDELLKARIRKERGNPPGKPNDPLGDQINWEQLLNNINKVDELYIISNDHDLLITVEKDSILNPILYEELKRKRKEIKIRCYHSLSNALLDLNKTSTEKLQNLPSKEVLNKIINKEEIDFQDNSRKEYFNRDLKGEELQRLTYMYTHTLIRKDQFIEGLKKLEFNQDEIQNFIHLYS